MTPAGGCGLTGSLAMHLVSGDGLSSCSEAMAGQRWPHGSPSHFPLSREVLSTSDGLCLGKARLQHPLVWNPPTWPWVAAGPGQPKVGEQCQISPSLLSVVGYTRVTVSRKQGSWKVPAPAEAANAAS